MVLPQQNTSILGFGSDVASLDSTITGASNMAINGLMFKILLLKFRRRFKSDQSEIDRNILGTGTNSNFNSFKTLEPLLQHPQ